MSNQKHDLNKAIQHMTGLVIMRKYAASIKDSNPEAHDRIMSTYNESLRLTKIHYSK